MYKPSKLVLAVPFISTVFLSGCFNNSNKEDVIVAEKVQSVEVQSAKEDIAHDHSNHNISNEKLAIEYKEGVHYRVLDDIKSNYKSNYIIEYFWLGCSHCQAFEPVIQDFLSKNENVKLQRKHASLNPRWGQDARVFYALKEMNEMAHFEDLFSFYKELGQKKTLPQKEDIEKFLIERKINVRKFFELTENKVVLDQIQEGLNEMISNKVTGVPALVINGKYLPIPNEELKTQDQYFDLIKYLLKNKP
jgi:thiol:disulfide interchange protein DsbA